MKKIVLLLIGLLFLSAYVSAYQVNIDAPDSLAVGKPLVVTGTTTFGIGTPIDVVLYYQLTTTTEIKRKIVYVQSDKTFKAVFDTTGLKKGMYKVEVPASGLGSSAVTMRIINLFDRSEDIYLGSSQTQPFNGRIYIAGTIKGDENSGVQIEVIGSDNTVVFGPRYVNTNYQGDFSTEVPITEPGEYEVSFTDARGYVGARIISVVGQSQIIPLTTTTTAIPVISAHTKSSRNNPAYFTVKPGYGMVNIRTSSSIDWVLEYVDDKGTLHTVNFQGEQKPEEIQVQGKGKTIFVKIYPYKYSDTSEVFLYVENAGSVVVSPTVPALFATTAPETTPTQQSPGEPLMGLVAAGISIMLCRYRH